MDNNNEKNATNKIFVPKKELSESESSELSYWIMKCYKLITGYGDKKALQHDVFTLTSPRKSMSRIRSFFGNIFLIPQKHRSFYLPLIGGLTYWYIEKLKDNGSIDEHEATVPLTNLKITLEKNNYGIELFRHYQEPQSRKI